MRTFFANRPSPAMGVAFVALLAALSGTAIALPGTSTVDSGDIKNRTIRGKDIRGNAVTTGKVKNNNLRGTDIRDNSLTGSDIDESTLGQVPSANSANSATTANSANNANHANTADSATVGAPAAFAEIEANGSVDTGSPSRGITDANVTNPSPGVYCFDLSFTPVIASANGNPDGVVLADDAILIYSLDPGQFITCPNTAEAEVAYVDASSAAVQSDDFNVQFDR